MMKKRGRGAMIAVVIIAFAIFGGVWGAWSMITNVFLPPTAHQGQTTILVIQQNEAADQIANDLYVKGLIRNPLAFRVWARIKGLDTSLEAGAYNLTSGMTIDQIIARLQNGQPDAKRLAVIDGFRIEQIAAALQALHLSGFNEQQFLTYTHHINQFPDAAKYPILQKAYNMEGLLYPDTYLIPVTYNTAQIIDMMLGEFTQAVQQKNLVARAQKHQLTEYQMIILASIIQREASNTTDMPLIAGIYLNRLDNVNAETVGFLGADPTVQYAHDTENPPANVSGYWRNLNDYGSGKTVATDSPWNTYVNKGLPPSPISSPNIYALLAAASPSATDCYYFLSKPSDGRVVCAATYNDFLALQKKYLP